MTAYFLPVVLAARTSKTASIPPLVPPCSFSALQGKELFLSLGVTLLCIQWSVSLGFDTCSILNSAPGVPPVANLIYFIDLKEKGDVNFYQCSFH